MSHIYVILLQVKLPIPHHTSSISYSIISGGEEIEHNKPLGLKSADAFFKFYTKMPKSKSLDIDVSEKETATQKRTDTRSLNLNPAMHQMEEHLITWGRGWRQSDQGEGHWCNEIRRKKPTQMTG